MLSADPQERETLAGIGNILGEREAKLPCVELDRGVHVVDEDVDGTDVRDLERPRKQHALDVVDERHVVEVAEPGLDVDAPLLCLLDLGLLRRLWELRRLGEPPVVHIARLAPASPADLLHAVVELDGVPVGVGDIRVPVAAGHIAPGAVDPNAALSEELDAVHDLGQGAGLPRDLVDVDAGGPAADGLQGLPGEEHEGVVVGVVVEEPTLTARDPLLLENLCALGVSGEIDDVGLLEAQQTPVEVDALVHPVDVVAEVAESPQLERPGQADSADAVCLFLRSHSWTPLLRMLHATSF